MSKLIMAAFTLESLVHLRGNELFPDSRMRAEILDLAKIVREANSLIRRTYEGEPFSLLDAEEILK